MYCELFLVTLAISIYDVIASDWSYDDVDNWSQNYPECGYDNQSPIDITINDDSCDDGSLEIDWNYDYNDCRI